MQRLGRWLPFLYIAIEWALPILELPELTERTGLLYLLLCVLFLPVREGKPCIIRASCSNVNEHWSRKRDGVTD